MSRETSPGAPPLDELAYQQAARALEQQAGVLDELRQRTSTLVAVSAIAASFLGAQALKSKAADQGPKALLALALISLLAALGLCLGVLVPTVMRRRRAGAQGAEDEGTDATFTRPRPKAADVVALCFSMNIETMIDRAEERGERVPYTARMDVARTLELHWEENASIIATKQKLFLAASVALQVQITAWIFYLAIGRGVI